MDIVITVLLTLVFAAFCLMLIAAFIWVIVWFVVRTRDRLGLAPDPLHERGKHCS